MVCLAQKVYEKGWEAKIEQRRVEWKKKEFDTYFVESLLERIKGKVRSTGANGVYALLFRNK